MPERPATLRDIVVAEAKKARIPPELAFAVIDPQGLHDRARTAHDLARAIALFDQQGCVYAPHVVGVMAGQELVTGEPSTLPAGYDAARAELEAQALAGIRTLVARLAARRAQGSRW